MIITILNGDDPTSESKFPLYLSKLANKFSESHSVQLYNLSSMNLHYCTGCFSCWMKTPGQCVIKDDAEDIFKSIINSDFYILASPIKAGFTSSTLKKITDRLIVLLHPYIEIINDECHHQKRYDSYPDFGLLLSKEEDTDDEDIAIITDIYDRFAINFHSKKRYLKFIEDNKIENIIYETCTI